MHRTPNRWTSSWAVSIAAHAVAMLALLLVGITVRITDSDVASVEDVHVIADRPWPLQQPQRVVSDGPGDIRRRSVRR